MGDTPFTPEQLERQAVQHLESLRQAGVEWLPAAAPLELAMSSAQGKTTPAAAPRLEKLGEPARPMELQMLQKKVSTCTRCGELAATRTQTVFGDGPLGAELCF